jgi:hypothetical protein
MRSCGLGSTRIHSLPKVMLAPIGWLEALIGHLAICNCTQAGWRPACDQLFSVFPVPLIKTGNAPIIKKRRSVKHNAMTCSGTTCKAELERRESTRTIMQSYNKSQQRGKQCGIMLLNAMRVSRMWPALCSTASSKPQEVTMYGLKWLTRAKILHIPEYHTRRETRFEKDWS